MTWNLSALKINEDKNTIPNCCYTINSRHSILSNNKELLGMYSDDACNDILAR